MTDDRKVYSSTTIRKNSREELRVTLEQYRGRVVANVRVWFVGEDGEQRPGKGGVGFRAELAGEVAKALAEADAAARAQGLIS